MSREVKELKKIVAEFVSRLAYESQQFERKFIAQIDLILADTLKVEIPKIQTEVKVVQLPETGYVRLKQIIGDKKAKPPIQGIFPIASSTWYRGIQLGHFPKPIKLGVRSVAWRVEDIRNMLTNPHKT